MIFSGVELGGVQGQEVPDPQPLKYFLIYLSFRRARSSNDEKTRF